MREGVAAPEQPTPVNQPSKSEARIVEEVAEPEVITTLMPTPTRVLPDETAVFYTVGVGDTLSRIAVLYGTTIESLMRMNGLTNANQLKIGQNLQVSFEAQYISPSDLLIPDSEMVLGPGYQTFDIETYVSSQPGLLGTYAESVLGVTMRGTEIIDLVATQYSIGPRVLLALLELKGGWVTNPVPSAQQQVYPLGYGGPDYWQGLYHQLILAADALNTGFYGWWYDDVWMVQTRDGVYIRYSEHLNAGTAGIQYALAKSSSNNEEFVLSLSRFSQVYKQLFGNPFDYAVEPLISPGAKALSLALPWQKGETWYLSGGPHSGWGTLGALSAVDFVTGERNIGCQVSQGWVTAAADGLVILSEDGMVLQDVDGDGYMGTGWVILYMHMSSLDRVPVESHLSVGDRIGHPSCEGGVSYASHLHFARRYNGVWIAADDYRWPMTLSGWTAAPGSQPYEGTMTKGTQVKTACECWEDVNAITHQ
jgi:murein DD-endopeptidase MepM/ murein hydrolase activator NlpD